MFTSIRTNSHTKVFFDTKDVVSVNRTKEEENKNEMHIGLANGRDISVHAESRKIADKLFDEMSVYAT